MESDLNCHNPDCKRWLGKAYGTTIASIKCPGCKMLNNFSYVSADHTEDLQFTFKQAEVLPVKKESQAS